MPEQFEKIEPNGVITSGFLNALSGKVSQLSGRDLRATPPLGIHLVQVTKTFEVDESDDTVTKGEAQFLYLGGDDKYELDDSITIDIYDTLGIIHSSEDRVYAAAVANGRYEVVYAGGVGGGSGESSGLRSCCGTCIDFGTVKDGEFASEYTIYAILQGDHNVVHISGDDFPLVYESDEIIINTISVPKRYMIRMTVEGTGPEQVTIEVFELESGE